MKIGDHGFAGELDAKHMGMQPQPIELVLTNQERP